MKNSERISVIVPVYNSGRYLEKCVDSILSQTYAEYETILINDGSTDDSGSICDRYARLYPDRIRTIHQTNRGAAAARNAGISAASGDYLAFIDSDDYIEPDMLSHSMDLIRKYGADMSAVEKWVEYEDGTRYCREMSDIEACWSAREALIWINSYRYLYTGFNTLVISRAALGDLRFPEGKRSEDYALQYRVIARCSRIVYSSKRLYHYVQTDESCSRTKNICLAPMDISMEQLAFFQQNYPDIVFAAETSCAFEHMGIWTAYLRSGTACPRELKRRLSGVVNRYLRSVLHNRYIPGIKKMQALAFCCAPPVYKWIIIRKEHR